MKKQIYALLALAAFTCGTPGIRAQAVNPNRTAPPSSTASPQNVVGGEIYGGYMIGVGDILDIHVNDEERVSGRYQVDQDGKLIVPLLSGAIPAAGTTTFELSTRLREELKKQDILREPAVTVLIVRGMTQNVSVLGAVMRPGTYPVEKPTSIMDVISLAGGLAPNAGSTATVSHQGDSHAPSVVNASVTTSNASVTTNNASVTTNNATATNNKDGILSINLTSLMASKDPAANVMVHPGDVITISTAPVVFVVGAVTRPGAFTVQDAKSRMTVLQAVAMAEGTTSLASLGKTIIVRQSSSDTERQEIPVDLKQVMRGKQKDEILEANDILFVPESGLKASLQRMGQIGTQAASQTLGYGMGLRIAP
jgi:polysaccharide export outer membrane protein